MTLNRISVFRTYFSGIKSKVYKVRLISKTTTVLLNVVNITWYTNTEMYWERINAMPSPPFLGLLRNKLKPKAIICTVHHLCQCSQIQVGLNMNGKGYLKIPSVRANYPHALQTSLKGIRRRIWQQSIKPSNVIPLSNQRTILRFIVSIGTTLALWLMYLSARQEAQNLKPPLFRH